MSLPQLDNAQIEAISGFIGDADREKGLERKEIKVKDLLNLILIIRKIICKNNKDNLFRITKYF